MDGTPVTYRDFIVFPECGETLEGLRSFSKQANGYYVVGPVENGRYTILHILYNGTSLYNRDKFRVATRFEGIEKGGVPPRVVGLSDANILPLICFEILFPEDYLPIEGKVDLVVHCVGCPMFDEDQKEGWVAMQKTLSIVLGCPVVCCCG